MPIMKIKAAIVSGMGRPFEIQEVELDQPGSDEILVRMVAVGICHTDLWVKNHVRIPMPAVLGHEGAGIVEKTGSQVTRFQAGDPVVLSYASCGVCPMCRNGRSVYCKDFNRHNLFGFRPDGRATLKKNGRSVFGAFFGQSSFATYALANERNAIQVPTDLPLEILAPLGCSIQTGAGTVINALAPTAGASIAVFGAGAVGLSAVMAAVIVGCSTVIGIDTNQERLQLALDLGATHIINSGKTNPLDAIKKIAGDGVDFSIESTGDPKVFRQATDVLDVLGTCALVSLAPPGTQAQVDMGRLLQGKTARGIIEGDCTPHDFIPKMIALFRQNCFPFDKLLTFYPFEEINQAALDAARGTTIKPVLKFS